MSHIFVFIGGGPRDGQTTVADPKDLEWSFEHGHYEPVDGYEILAGHTPEEGDFYHMIWKPGNEGRQSRTVATVEELEALKPGSIVRDPAGIEWEYHPDADPHWLSTNRFEMTTEALNLPVTVLWEEPEAS